MYKVGKVFMEDAYIGISSFGERFILCPICGEKIFLEDNEGDGDIIFCDLCETTIKLFED